MNKDNRKLDVLVSCISNSWGGMEIMAMEFAKQLVKQGFTISVLCPEFSKLEEFSTIYGIKTICTKLNFYQNIKLLKNILGNVKIIHSHFSHDLWTIVPALRLSRSTAKLFLTKHLASGIKKNDFLHKKLYNRVERVFAISEFIKENAEATIPVPAEKISVVQNGINLEKFDKIKYSGEEIRSTFGISKNKTVVTLIGRITPGKGHNEFINAAEIINKSLNENTVFLITGNAVKEEILFENEVKNLVSSRGLKNIFFTGYRNDIAQVLAATDILAFPSHEESFGITLLEAMAMGVPVVASNNAGIKDIIPSEEFGILVPPKDHRLLAEGLLKLINDSALRNKLASGGRRRVIENFDIEKITKKLVQYYFKE